MKNNASWRWPGSRLVVALGFSLFLAIGGGCALAPDVAVEVEATVQDSLVAAPAGFLIVYQCFGPDGRRVGLPKSPLSACLVACPSGGTCVRCVFRNNAVDCDL